ncbi:unnamed protein product [Notodromas monacha]|uniref:LIM zinc-binding domain-containing protein n=1 Tax=Notodromas monacha TaxID=399045 RepID=A0A7R9GFL3_9CRUS|nr:unnamed protein product [Notodromas monacha]CAG0919463.1 unnamed protein product [Notodromas monacha]
MESSGFGVTTQHVRGRMNFSERYVIDTSDMAYEQQALLLSPSSMEPPKEKPPPPPPVEPPPMTDPETNTSSELDESVDKSVLRHTVSSSSSAVSQRSSSPPSVQIRPASGTSNGPLPVRSTSVSNRVKMWETGNFPRKPAEESDDDQGSSKSSSVTTSGDSRQRFEETRPVSVLSTASTLPRPDVGVSLTKENVRKKEAMPDRWLKYPMLYPIKKEAMPDRWLKYPMLYPIEMYHNPAFSARDSPLPTQQAASSTNYYQNVAELRAGGRHVEYQSDAVQYQLNSGYIGSSSDQSVPRSVSATGFGRQSQQSSVPAMQPSSHSDSSLRPAQRTEDVMWKSANGNSAWNKQDKMYGGQKQDPFIGNGYQPPQPWSDDAAKASRSRSVEDLQQQQPPHHINQPIYENLPPPVKRSGPVAQPVDPAPFHSSQVMGTSRNGPTVSIGPWQQQGQPSSHVPVGHGFGDPRLVGNTNNPANNTGPPMLSVSGKKKCSHCGRELGRGAAMIVESLRLFYHLECFRCCVCEAPLGNGKTGADVRVRNNRLHCHNCYSNEQGVKFSKE